jgi:hypothetical protein
MLKALLPEETGSILVREIDQGLINKNVYIYRD